MISCDLVNRALHVEGLLRLLVMGARKYLRKATDRLLARDVLTRVASKGFAHKERLGEESLELTRPLDHAPILFGKFLDAKDGDDVLQVFIALQHALYLVSNSIMLLAYNLGRQGR